MATARTEGPAMKNYIALWVEQLVSRPRRSLNSAISVTGTVKQVAPRPMFAVVSLSATPFAQFEVSDLTGTSTEVARFGFPDWFVFGLLDVLMADEHGPLTRLRIILNDVKYHDVDTDREAFIHAGSDAGRQICRWSAPDPEPRCAAALRSGATLR
jgi:hypothetical protein